jgi:hypothetical protein
MSSTTQKLIDETLNLPVNQVEEKCTQWLQDNPNASTSDKALIQGLHSLATRQKQELAKKDQVIAKKDQVIAKKDQVIAKKDQVIAKKDQVIANMKEESEEKDKVIEKRSLSSIKHDFPALKDRTLSGPHVPHNHKHAQVHELDIDGNFGRSATSWCNENFWKAASVDYAESCDCEASAQRLVVNLLQSMLVGLGLNDFVGLVEHRTLAEMECDILLVYKTNMLPFAVIEVKKPCNSNEQRKSVWFGLPNGSNLVAGQVFDNMSAIQLYGFPRVCGMISTWNHWRLVGKFADDEKDLAKAVTNVRKRLGQGTNSEKRLEEIKRRFISQNETKKRPRRGIDNDSPDRPKLEFECDKKNNGANWIDGQRRDIWASKIVPSFDFSTEDEVLKEVQESGEPINWLGTLFIVNSCENLLDFLQDGKYSTSSPTSTIRSPRPCRVLTDNEQVFAFSTINLDKINFNKFNPNLKRLHVIHHLGRGDSGNCCLAVSETGSSCCAVKFFHPSASRPDDIADECGNWNTVYSKLKDFPNCRVVKTGNGWCLVMPYLHPIPKGDRWQYIENGQIETALKQFCESGFLHPEIMWRHIGLWQKNQVVLLDLGTLEKQSDKVKQDDWCKKSIEELRQKAGGQKDAKVTPTAKRTKRRKTG